MNTPNPRDRVLRFIAFFKFVKAALLLAVSLGVLRLLNPTAAEPLRHWVTTLVWRLRPRAGAALTEMLEQLPHSRIEIFSLLLFGWAALFTLEGIGLWREKRWAENLTIIVTASFMPFELYELARHATWPRALTLTFNLLVVGYLIWRKRYREK
jgi:uncharacterized membrane protein (DUF2068 family)